MTGVQITRVDLLHLLEAFESVEVELDQLIYDKEWYVTDVLDLLTSGKQIVQEKLEEIKNADKN